MGTKVERKTTEVEAELTPADRRTVKDAALGLYTSRTQDRHNQDTFVSDCYVTAVLTLLNSKGYSLVKTEDNDGRQQK